MCQCYLRGVGGVPPLSDQFVSSGQVVYPSDNSCLAHGLFLLWYKFSVLVFVFSGKIYFTGTKTAVRFADSRFCLYFIVSSCIPDYFCIAASVPIWVPSDWRFASAFYVYLLFTCPVIKSPRTYTCTTVSITWRVSFTQAFSIHCSRCGHTAQSGL